MRLAHLKCGAALAVALKAASVLPAQADAVQKLLYAKDGPIVSGISYCYGLMSGREGLDRAASKRRLVRPTDALSNIYPTEKPGPKRRALIRNDSGPHTGTGVKGGPTDISLRISYRETNCEVAVFGVPKEFGPQVVPVTTKVFAKLNRDLTLELPFGKILVAGKGPSWHGGPYFKSDKYSGGVNFDIYPSGTAVWGIDLVRSDIRRKKYGG